MTIPFLAIYGMASLAVIVFTIIGWVSWKFVRQDELVINFYLIAPFVAGLAIYLWGIETLPMNTLHLLAVTLVMGLIAQSVWMGQVIAHYFQPRHNIPQRRILRNFVAMRAPYR